MVPGPRRSSGANQRHVYPGNEDLPASSLREIRWNWGAPWLAAFARHGSRDGNLARINQRQTGFTGSRRPQLTEDHWNVLLFGRGDHAVGHGAEGSADKWEQHRGQDVVPAGAGHLGFAEDYVGQKEFQRDPGDVGD